MVRSLAGLRLPGDPPGAIGGRRETRNEWRRFITGDSPLDAAGAAVAEAFQARGLAAVLAARCGADLEGAYLRIEYCRDTAGFWLEPHTDIAAKRFTLIVYLNDPPSAEDWGTDLYDAAGRRVGGAPSRSNAGLAFVPATDTWHGFAPRPITGERRSLIVNYVEPAWRSRHELAFPARPIRL
ncbi:MAG TPA: 2OG-Fe(II) oxygenase [Stellaceae bacterium]|nr:2OG-Fe(II) oxygenase [Stellaceae bacterium]